jgi:arginyl-tRNA--protein-N-Asp/Glu arginylyltransferase
VLRKNPVHKCQSSDKTHRDPGMSAIPTKQRSDHGWRWSGVGECRPVRSTCTSHTDRASVRTLVSEFRRCHASAWNCCAKNAHDFAV